MSLWHTCLYCKEYYDFNKGHFCKYKIGDKLTCFKEGLSKFEVCKKYEIEEIIRCVERETFEDLINMDILIYIDILVDGPYIKELKKENLKYRGSSNQRIIDVQKSLKENKIIIYMD